MTESILRRPPAPAVNSLSAVPYGIAAREDRCGPRQRLLIPAKMRLSCCSSFGVQVTEMSRAGFVCDALLEVHPGTRCWLMLPGLGALEAEVIHHNHQGVGCAFKNLLNEAVLNHYVMKYPPQY